MSTVIPTFDARDAVLGDTDFETAYVIGVQSVFVTEDAGSNWTDITGDLLTFEPGELRSMEFIPSAGHGLLVVGTNRGVFATATDALGIWLEVGDLPKAPVLDMQYWPEQDLLIAGLLGRGAWTVTGLGGEVPPEDCPPGSNVINGTEGSDNIVGTEGADCIFGLGGNDVIDGRGGDDTVFGGAGSDSIQGGFGSDALHGGDDNDTIDGGPGDDFIDGDAGVDTCAGGTGVNAISCEVAAHCTAACCATNSCSGPPDALACGPAFTQQNCLSFVQGTIVSRDGDNWECTNGNCANCATFSSCAPGATGCPWGVVRTDRGVCE